MGNFRRIGKRLEGDISFKDGYMSDMTGKEIRGTTKGYLFIDKIAGIAEHPEDKSKSIIFTNGLELQVDEKASDLIMIIDF